MKTSEILWWILFLWGFFGFVYVLVFMPMILQQELGKDIAQWKSSNYVKPLPVRCRLSGKLHVGMGLWIFLYAIGIIVFLTIK